eukprot:scaffold6915_cov170-Amphora_coffeaeformis.AAC.7
MHDFEIVGLPSSNNGRRCCLYECCGKEVFVGDVLQLVACTVAVEEVVEDAIKLVKVVEGIDQCTVSELYHNSDNTYKRDKSYKNCGTERVSTLDEEGKNE